MATSAPACHTTITFFIGEFAALTAWSAIAFNGTVLPPRNPPSAVINMRGAESSILLLSDSDENPPNTMLCGAPIRAQASIATASSGIIGMYMATRSPFLTPFALSTSANLFTSR